MRPLLLFFALLGCQAQQEMTGEVSLLARIRARIAANLNGLPNFTCAEKVERSARATASHKWKVIDTVRLEVALVNGSELYGWAGANRIAESQLSSLVGGTIGNGDFALVARGIFQARGTTFDLRGDSTINEQPSIRYDYRVPLESSGYHLKSGDKQAVVPYHGSFWVDPESLDLLRLELSAEEIPAYLGLAASTKTLDYQRVKIGTAGFVLPSDAMLNMVDLSGRENRNRSHFHDCRQYTAEATLSFTNFYEQPAAASNKSIRELDLPPDFKADLSLSAPLDLSISSVGDPIQVRLVHALRAGREVLVPVGATLTARIIELQLAGSFYRLGLAFESLQFQNSHANLSGRRNSISVPQKMPATGHRTLRGYDAARLRVTGDFVIESGHLHLPRGFSFCLHSKLIESQQ